MTIPRLPTPLPSLPERTDAKRQELRAGLAAQGDADGHKRWLAAVNTPGFARS